MLTFIMKKPLANFRNPRVRVRVRVRVRFGCGRAVGRFIFTCVYTCLFIYVFVCICMDIASTETLTHLQKFIDPKYERQGMYLLSSSRKRALCNSFLEICRNEPPPAWFYSIISSQVHLPISFSYILHSWITWHSLMRLSLAHLWVFANVPPRKQLSLKI